MFHFPAVCIHFFYQCFNFPRFACIVRSAVPLSLCLYRMTGALQSNSFPLHRFQRLCCTFRRFAAHAVRFVPFPLGIDNEPKVIPVLWKHSRMFDSIIHDSSSIVYVNVIMIDERGTSPLSSHARSFQHTFCTYTDDAQKNPT